MLISFEKEPVELPDEFTKFIDKVKQMASDIINVKGQGTDNIIQVGLETVSVEDLKQLQSIMDTTAGGRRGSTEERVVKMVSVMFPTIEMLEHAKATITKVQVKMQADFVNVYVDEYTSYVSGAAHFNNDLFLKHVQKELHMREARLSSAPKPKSSCHT